MNPIKEIKTRGKCGECDPRHNCTISTVHPGHQNMLKKTVIVPITTYFGIITHISHPAKVGLVLKLEPSARSLGWWSYAPSPLPRGSALSFSFQPLVDLLSEKSTLRGAFFGRKVPLGLVNF